VVESRTNTGAIDKAELASQPSRHGAIGPAKGVGAARLRHARNMCRALQQIAGRRGEDHALFLGRWVELHVLTESGCQCCLRDTHDHSNLDVALGWLKKGT